jgi:hypothetical protein
VNATIEQSPAATAMQTAAEAIDAAVKAGITPWTPEDGSITAADVAGQIMDATARAAATADAPWLSPAEGLLQARQLMAVHAVQESLEAARAKSPQALRDEADALRAQINYLYTQLAGGTQ